MICFEEVSSRFEERFCLGGVSEVKNPWFCFIDEDAPAWTQRL